MINNFFIFALCGVGVSCALCVVMQLRWFLFIYFIYLWGERLAGVWGIKAVNSFI